MKYNENLLTRFVSEEELAKEVLQFVLDNVGWSEDHLVTLSNEEAGENVKAVVLAKKGIVKAFHDLQRFKKEEKKGQLVNPAK